MDAVDLKILRVLKKNARVSYLNIGKAVNLSTSAVIERIKRLEKSGAISAYTAIINGTAFDKELTALMFISLESPRFNDGFLKFVELEPDILECHYLTGNYDYMLKIVTQNPSTLELLLNKIKSQPGIMKTYTNVVLKTIKNEYSITPGT
jgi:Lrp/AsnC family leucine-responsive transcriptional regulator